jgi:hypothetical protein
VTERHGSAKHADRGCVRDHRPPALTGPEVEALGKLSEALEVIEHARGLLYGLHRLCGTADLALQEAVAMFRDAGHESLADDLETSLVGRDVIDGRWSFELVEAYDRGYWTAFRDAEAHARATLGDVAQHLYEAKMKFREQRPNPRTETGTPEG